MKEFPDFLLGTVRQGPQNRPRDTCLKSWGQSPQGQIQTYFPLGTWRGCGSQGLGGGQSPQGLGQFRFKGILQFPRTNFLVKVPRGGGLDFLGKVPRDFFQTWGGVLAPRDFGPQGLWVWVQSLGLFGQSYEPLPSRKKIFLGTLFTLSYKPPKVPRTGPLLVPRDFADPSKSLDFGYLKVPRGKSPQSPQTVSGKSPQTFSTKSPQQKSGNFLELQR